MILMSTYCVGEVPFRYVYLHGMVRDGEGRKMSKSLDNIIDPLDMIARYGTDAVRLSLVIGSTPGNDLNLPEERIAGFRNFTNKLWNIERYVLTTVSEIRRVDERPEPKTAADAWILVRLEAVVRDVTEKLDAPVFAFSAAGETLRDFTWNDFADWYVEVSKTQRKDVALQSHTDAVLLFVFQTLLKLWHPFMPFVTQKLWELVDEDPLMIQLWPKTHDINKYQEGKIHFENVRRVIAALRSVRADFHAPPKVRLKFFRSGSFVAEITDTDHAYIQHMRHCTLMSESTRATAIVKRSFFTDSFVSVALHNAIDIDAERNRIQKELVESETYVLQQLIKLQDEHFVANAPLAVQKSLEQKVEDARRKSVTLTTVQRTRIEWLYMFQKNCNRYKKSTNCSRAAWMRYPDAQWLRTELMSGRRLRVYTGWDPTTTDVHIGHTAWMWKLRQFQELGHEFIVLMGTFTATLGDPSGKADTRKPMTLEETRRNAKGFVKKTKAIFDVPGNPITVKSNHEWLAKMSFADVIGLASHFTVQQMLERDMFEKRITGGYPIGLHEFLYPLMQGDDSVAMDVDVEVGGTDQTFNMLAGRTLMKKMKNKNKGVLTLHLLTDASGRKIGKSEGNAINIDAAPEDLFGKVMTLPDSVIWRAFEMVTPMELGSIASLKLQLEDDPRAAKMKLAHELVRIYNGNEAAIGAEQYFESVFSRKEIPEEAESFLLKDGVIWTDVLVESKMCSSKSDARRQIKQGAVKLDGRVIADGDETARAGILQKGKRHFRKLHS